MQDWQLVLAAAQELIDRRLDSFQFHFEASITPANGAVSDVSGVFETPVCLVGQPRSAPADLCP